ncbi:MAG: cobalamin B12-binding domain-containing protein, partial [Gammaproteobacteria bacterium]|nr:cobalamin B12-binding domain-containing protein [Gammaproteobacteria bacterium]
MKKILLINPPYTTFFDSKHFSISRPNKDGITTSIPHGLACLAGFLRGKNIAVRCLDLEVIPMSLEGILDLIKSENYEIVGFTSTTPLISTAIKIAQYLKENTSSILVLGGVHASA